ncbi:hypothetical protein GCM10027168_44580 [Streptomyces capparidis]
MATPTTDRTDAALDQALVSVTSELGRTDQKAGLLLALDGGLLAVFAALRSNTGGAAALDLPAPARATAALGAAALVASVVLLLISVRPRLAGRHRTGLVHWADLEPEQLATALRRDHRPEQITVLSRLARSKFELLRQAIDLSLAAVLLLTAAAAITAWA